MKTIKLIKQPSLINATSKDAVMNILTNKMEEYEYNEARLLDYIANSFNKMQVIINDIKLEETDLKLRLEKAEETKNLVTNVLAEALKEVGVTELKDKTSTIGSSIKYVEPTEEVIELKERKLTLKEALELLEFEGYSITKMEDKKTESKPASLKMMFKKGQKIAELKTKEAKEKVIERLESELDEDDLNILGRE